MPCLLVAYAQDEPQIKPNPDQTLAQNLSIPIDGISRLTLSSGFACYIALFWWSMSRIGLYLPGRVQNTSIAYQLHTKILCKQCSKIVFLIWLE